MHDKEDNTNKTKAVTIDINVLHKAADRFLAQIACHINMKRIRLNMCACINVGWPVLCVCVCVSCNPLNPQQDGSYTIQLKHTTNSTEGTNYDK